MGSLVAARRSEDGMSGSREATGPEHDGGRASGAGAREAGRDGGESLVRVETGQGVATLTLDSPHNRNALSTPLMTQLLAALDAAEGDESVRVVVISHTGPVFCSGADLKETAEAVAPGSAGSGPRSGATRPDGAGFPGPSASGASATSSAPRPAESGAGRGAISADSADSRGRSERSEPTGTASGRIPVAMLGDLLAAIWECPKPVVARVAGPARAGGLGLVAAADIAICAEEATFAFSEVRLGVVPAVISATVLPRLTPRAAAELFLTGDTFDGRRAERIGLVTQAAPADTLDATVAAYCQALVLGGPEALAGTKGILHRRATATVREELSELSALSVGYFQSEEGREGVRAFREKRHASWVPEGSGRG
jgi:methylglutaconyl-CoA hydratase